MCSWPGHANLQGSRARLSLGPIWAHRANISLAPSLPFILLLTQGPFWRLTQPRPCLTQGFSSAMSWAPHLIILSKPVSFVLLWALTSVTILLLLKCLERILKWVRGCGKEEGKMNEFWETRPKGSASRRLTTCSSHSAPGHTHTVGHIPGLNGGSEIRKQGEMSGGPSPSLVQQDDRLALKH